MRPANSKELVLYKLDHEIAVADGKVLIPEGTSGSLNDFTDLF